MHVRIDRLYYYGLGTRFGASRPFDHARSIAFCSFLRHFLCLECLWTTVIFFHRAWKHSRWLVMCSSNVGTQESPGLSDFHPCRSRRSLAIALDLSSAMVTYIKLQEEQSILRWKKMLVWILKPEWSDKRLSSKKKCESLGSDPRDRQCS